MNTKYHIQSVPYQPFLIALFIGISIYAPNRSYFPIDAMILPMGILFSIVGIALIILGHVTGDLNKNQIFISCALILNFTYYTSYEATLVRWFNIAPATIIYPAIFFLLIVVIWKITNSQASKVSSILNMISIVVLLISLTNLGLSIASDAKELGSIEQKQAFEAQFQTYLTEDLTNSLNNRSFYFIILDRYPGEETLNAEYGFNNSLLYQNLSAKGFNIIRGSKSNYGATLKSIPSMVNMDYYDSAKQAGYDEENNRLWKFFKSQGFKFVFLPTAWVTTYKNDNADVVMNPFPISLDRSSQYRIFQEIMFFERTFVGKVYYIVLHLLFNQEIPSATIEDLQLRIRDANDQEETEFRGQISTNTMGFVGIHVLNTFENLTQVPKIPGKKFVFAHINGWEQIANKTSNYTTKLQSANQRIESTVRRIIAESDKDPVIVLLSDHGKKPSAEAIERSRSVFEKYACYPNRSLDDEYIKTTWYSVNNIEAFYLPDGGNKCIYPSMTPINAWRVILNYYFGTGFPRIEDKSYWSSPEGECEVSNV